MLSSKEKREQWLKEHPNATKDIGNDLTPEDEAIFDRIRAEKPPMTEEEVEAQLKWLREAEENERIAKSLD